jgi:hypothetical protein
MKVVIADQPLYGRTAIRQAPYRLSIKTIGTLAVLARAAEKGLLNVEAAFAALGDTSFRARPSLVASIGCAAAFPFASSTLPPFLHVVDGLLGHPIHGGTSLGFRRHSHADEQREPAGLVPLHWRSACL